MVILIIHVFCMYEFTYLLKCVCNPEISTHSTFTDICSHKQNGKKFELRISRVPAEVERGNTLPCFKLLYCKQGSFSWFVVPHFLHRCDFDGDVSV